MHNAFVTSTARRNAHALWRLHRRHTTCKGRYNTRAAATASPTASPLLQTHKLAESVKRRGA
jgi:hypothetical protein